MRIQGQATSDQSLISETNSHARTAADGGSWSSSVAEANPLLWSLSSPLERQQLVAEHQLHELLSTRLKPLAQSAQGFNELLKSSFGEYSNIQAASDLRAQILNADTQALPRVHLVDAAELHGALGAYSEALDTIFLDRELAGTPLGEQTLLEEFGHAIDARINAKDAAGDEGELFRLRVNGDAITTSQLNRIRAENDGGTISINGQSLAVEFRQDGGYSGPDYPWNPGGVASGSPASQSTHSSNTGGYSGPDYPWNPGGVASGSPTTPATTQNTSSTSNSTGGYTGPDYPWNPGGIASGSPTTPVTTQNTSSSSNSTGGYTGPDYPWNPGGVAVNPPVTKSADSETTGSPPVSIRQIEERSRLLREQAESLADDIDALGTSGGYVTDAMRAELLDVLVELEGGDISTAWQVRDFMEQGMSLGDSRLRAREAAQPSADYEISNDQAVTGLTDDQFDSMVNALIADGMSPSLAADTVMASAVEHQRERNETINTYVANLLNVSPSMAQDIIDFNHGNVADLDGLPADVTAALSRVDIRFINGTDQPFLVGQPRDVEIIGDHFGDEYGATLSAYGLNDGTWATERPLDAHLAESAPFDVHLFLDVLGFVPVVGEFADGLNAVIYLAEGDFVNAGISAVALVPVAGSTATGARVLARSQDMINGLGAVLKGSSKVDGVTVNVLEMSDGSIIKVLELEDGQSVVVRGSAEALGESADELAAAGRIDGAAPDINAPRREIPFDSDEVLVGTSRSNMRREAARLIADDPNHPLRFLLNNNGTGFKPANGQTHFDLINQPDVVQMGHVVSAKTGHTEYVVLQTAYENQLLNNTIERSSIGGAVLGFEVVEIGGVAVSRETAELWELLDYLPAGTVANAPLVNIPAPPPGT